jgi:putative DNA primase/helicase
MCELFGEWSEREPTTGVTGWSVPEALTGWARQVSGASSGGSGMEDGAAMETRPRAEIAGDLSVDHDTARKVVAEGNAPPTVFRTGGKLTRTGRDDEGAPVIRLFSQPLVLDWLDRAAEWGFWRVERNQAGRVTRREWVHQNPPSHCATYLVHAADTITDAPVLEQVVTMPYFAADGTLVQERGYSAAGRAWLEPSLGASALSVPADPSPGDLRAAVRLLITDLLGDFAFAGPGDRAHALAMLLQPFCRQLIGGPTPLYLVHAPTAGTGKGMLVRACAAVSYGRQVPARSLPASEEEMRKTLTAIFLAGQPVVWFDNVRHFIDSGVLAQATAEQEWGDRILGASETISARVRCQWVMTGNNVRLSKELARRAAPSIRLDPTAVGGISAEEAERPYLRAGFKHPDLIGWAEENRAELATACLTIIQSWIAAGRLPWSGKPIGTYEVWSRVMGGITEHAGSAGFLAGYEEKMRELDGEHDELGEFVEKWHARHGESIVTTTDLIVIAAQCEGDVLRTKGTATERGASTSAGAQLKNMAGQVVDGLVIKKGKKRSTWQLVRYGASQ